MTANKHFLMHKRSPSPKDDVENQRLFALGFKHLLRDKAKPSVCINSTLQTSAIGFNTELGLCARDAQIFLCPRRHFGRHIKIVPSVHPSVTNSVTAIIKQEGSWP